MNLKDFLSSRQNPNERQVPSRLHRPPEGGTRKGVLLQQIHNHQAKGRISQQPRPVRTASQDLVPKPKGQGKEAGEETGRVHPQGPPRNPPPQPAPHTSPSSSPTADIGGPAHVTRLLIRPNRNQLRRQEGIWGWHSCWGWKSSGW